MKNLLTILLLCVLGVCHAQQIPNADFDSVYIGGIDRIFQWTTADGVIMYSGELQNEVFPMVADSQYMGPGFLFSEMVWINRIAYQDPFSKNSIQIVTDLNRRKSDSTSFPSFILSGESFATDNQGYIDFFKSGYDFSYRPDSIKGYYKFEDSLPNVENTGRILLYLKKYKLQSGQTDTIAYLNSTKALTTSSNWRPFSVAIPYLSNEIPDSLSLSFFSSSMDSSFGMLWLDEIEFVYSSVRSTPPIKADIKLFPNPCQDILHIQNKDRKWTIMEIVHITGKSMLKGRFTSTISVSGLPSGYYFLKLNDLYGNSFYQAFQKI
ncbi:MAG: T9SS type A sorting domain-containing protein [Bacteroidia bacterium]|nr:T9SS type A sorting domain-containing protein [Bacteroidia bacterium]